MAAAAAAPARRGWAAHQARRRRRASCGSGGERRAAGSSRALASPRSLSAQHPAAANRTCSHCSNRMSRLLAVASCRRARRRRNAPPVGWTRRGMAAVSLHTLPRPRSLTYLISHLALPALSRTGEQPAVSTRSRVGGPRAQVRRSDAPDPPGPPEAGAGGGAVRAAAGACAGRGRGRARSGAGCGVRRRGLRRRTAPRLA